MNTMALQKSTHVLLFFSPADREQAEQLAARFSATPLGDGEDDRESMPIYFLALRLL
jgi:hypothetical protein